MCFYPCVSVCIQCVSHLNACMWACVACCLDTYINLQCVVKKINWQALRLSNLKQFNLPYSVPDVILPQWQLTVWQQAGRALTHTHTLHRDNDKHWILRNMLRQWVAGGIRLVWVTAVCVTVSGALFPQHSELCWLYMWHRQIYGPFTQHSTVLLCWSMCV